MSRAAGVGLIEPDHPRVSEVGECPLGTIRTVSVAPQRTSLVRVGKTDKVAAPHGTSEGTPGHFGPDEGANGNAHRRPKRSGGGRGRSGGAPTSRARRPGLLSGGAGRKTALVPA
ncbi:MAG: hypothetical protein H6657_14510 [Ardenticatenaceae bacterium]|nr:hypothetical protein [Ardenticatenaceae bacterium]